MKKLAIPIYVLYKLWIFIVFWGSLLIMYPFFRIAISKKKWFPFVFKLKRFWSWWISLFIGCPIVRTWKGELPKSPYIVVTNHSSYLDIVFLYSVIPDYFLLVGKGELMKWPLFSMFLKRMDIPVNRENIRSAYGSLKKAYEALERGEGVALFPEGTVPDHAPTMARFKNGAFKMAVETQSPIVAITWQTNYFLLSEPEKIIGRSLPGVCRVLIHKPFYPKDYGNDVVELRTAVFNAIDSGLPKEYQKK